MIDNYNHIDGTVFYTPENIPGPRESSAEYDKIIDDFNSQIIHHCVCDLCSLECPCIKGNYGVNFIKLFPMRTLDISADLQAKISPLECNDYCMCSRNCVYRNVQKGPIKNLFIKKCEDEWKGYGLFTRTFIPKGSFICEYAGEILTKTQAGTRYHLNSLKNKMNYIFCLQEITNDKVMQTFIDPSVFGNIGRYINHSCEPNCFIIPVRVNCMIPKIAIFSCYDICPGSEITFNYGINENDFKMEPPLSCSNKKKICLCNSSKCQGYLPFEP